MNHWFYINLLTFLYALFSFLWNSPKSGNLFLAVLSGLFGLFFILFNWNMHAIFAKIRKLRSREQRIRIAKYARKIMPFHLYIGSLGFLFILVHLFLIASTYGGALHFKTGSGYLAFGALIVVLISGWLRKYKASKFHRLFHLYSSFVLFFLVVLHLLL